MKKRNLTALTAAVLMLSCVPVMAQDPEDLDQLIPAEDIEFDEEFDVEEITDDGSLDETEEELLNFDADFDDDISFIPEDLDTGASLVQNAADYVTLGDLEHLEVDRQVYSVTDEDVQERISQELSAYSTEEDASGPAAEGDFVYANITYTIQSSGESTTLDDTIVCIGDAYYGEAFDDALTGCSTGDTISVTVSYDAADEDAEWPGETVDFKVEVEGVTSIITPEYTDDFVKENYGYDSKEEFEQMLRDTIQAEYDSSSDNELYYNALSNAVQLCTFTDFPEDMIQSSKDALIDTYSFYFDGASVTYEDIADLFGMTTEDLDQAVIDDLKYTVFISAYAQANDIRIPRSGYTDYILQEARYAGYPSVEAYENDYGRDALIQGLYEEKVADALLETAEVNDILYTTGVYDNLLFEDEAMEVESEG